MTWHGQDAEFEQLVAAVWGTSVKVEVLLRILGLASCRNTVIGGPMLRGSSGGEKKRVTSAEHLVGPKVRFLPWCPLHIPLREWHISHSQGRLVNLAISSQTGICHLVSTLPYAFSTSYIWD